MKQVNKTVVFFVFTLLFSYGVAGVFYLAEGYKVSYGSTIFALLYMFIPTLGVLLVEKVIHNEEVVNRLYLSFKLNKWFLVAWVVPPLLAMLTLGISLLFGQVTYSSGMEGMLERYRDLLSPAQLEEMQDQLANLPLDPFLLMLVQGMGAGITVNALAAFGEEFGWRGFLVRQFQNISFIQAALVTGFFWGIWHAPLVLMGHNYPHHPQAGVVMMTLWTLLLSPLFLYITIRSKSVIAASLMHGTLNGTAGLAIAMVSGGSDLLVGVTGIAGFIALVIFLAGLFFYDSYISGKKIMWQKIGNLNEEKKYQK